MAPINPRRDLFTAFPRRPSIDWTYLITRGQDVNRGDRSCQQGLMTLGNSEWNRKEKGPEADDCLFGGALTDRQGSSEGSGWQLKFQVKDL